MIPLKATSKASNDVKVRQHDLGEAQLAMKLFFSTLPCNVIECFKSRMILWRKILALGTRNPPLPLALA